MSVPARAAERAGTLTYRPVRVDEIETCAGIWRTAINDYIVRLGQEEVPPEIDPSSGCSRTCSRPIPSGSSSPAGRTRTVARRSSRSRSRSGVSGCGTCRCCSCCPRSREPGSVASCSRASCRTTTATASSGQPRRTAPSRSRMRCTRRTGSPRGCRCSTCPACRNDPRPLAGSRRASCRWRSRRSRTVRPEGRATRGWRPPSTGWIASSWAPRTRWIIGSSARSNDVDGSTTGQTAFRSGTGMPARPAGSDRSPSATRRWSRRSSAT